MKKSNDSLQLSFDFGDNVNPTKLSPRGESRADDALIIIWNIDNGKETYIYH